MANILCVDDESAIRLIVQDTLERLGHTTVGAQNAAEALAAAERGGVDLIVSDYRMPGISGLELLEMLRNDGFDIPLIMLTGHGTIEQAVEAIRAGAMDYITKPIEPEQLGHAVAKALEITRLIEEHNRTHLT